MATKKPSVDYTKISMHAAAIAKQRAALAEIERCGRGVLITDCLSHKSEGGLIVLQALAEQEKYNPRRYYIRVLKDKWGQPVKQGDTVKWLAGRKLRDPFGRKLTSRYIKELERRGGLGEIETWHEAEVDQWGCIEVTFEDACILLNTYGVHHVSGNPLTGRREKLSSPTMCPDGVERVQHFWLYAEVPPWEHGDDLREAIDAYDADNKPVRRRGRAKTTDE